MGMMNYKAMNNMKSFKSTAWLLPQPGDAQRYELAANCEYPMNKDNIFWTVNV